MTPRRGLTLVWCRVRGHAWVDGGRAMLGARVMMCERCHRRGWIERTGRVRPEGERKLICRVLGHAWVDSGQATPEWVGARCLRCGQHGRVAR